MANKKATSISIVILSLLLAAALATTIVLAAFTAQKTATTTIQFANGITLNVTGAVTATSSGSDTDYFIGAGNTANTAFTNLTGQKTIVGTDQNDKISAAVSSNSPTAYLTFTITLANVESAPNAPGNAAGTLGQGTATWDLGENGVVTLTAAQGVILVAKSTTSATFAVATYTSDKATSTEITTTATDLITSITVDKKSGKTYNDLAGTNFTIGITFDASTDKQFNDASLSA